MPEQPTTAEERADFQQEVREHLDACPDRCETSVAASWCSGCRYAKLAERLLADVDRLRQVGARLFWKHLARWYDDLVPQTADPPASVSRRGAAAELRWLWGWLQHDCSGADWIEAMRDDYRALGRPAPPEE